MSSFTKKWEIGIAAGCGACIAVIVAYAIGTALKNSLAALVIGALSAGFFYHPKEVLTEARKIPGFIIRELRNSWLWLKLPTRIWVFLNRLRRVTLRYLSITLCVFQWLIIYVGIPGIFAYASYSLAGMYTKGQSILGVGLPNMLALMGIASVIVGCILVSIAGDLEEKMILTKRSFFFRILKPGNPSSEKGGVKSNTPDSLGQDEKEALSEPSWMSLYLTANTLLFLWPLWSALFGFAVTVLGLILFGDVIRLLIISTLNAALALTINGRIAAMEGAAVGGTIGLMALEKGALFVPSLFIAMLSGIFIAELVYYLRTWRIDRYGKPLLEH